MSPVRDVPRALVCDLDGVLRIWDARELAEVEREHGVEPGVVAAVAYVPERLTPAITGQVTDTEWRLTVAAALVERVGSIEQAASLVSEWGAAVGAVDEGVRSLLRDVRRRGVPVVLVGNATTKLETDLSVLGLNADVDAVVSSARVKVAMPDPAIYVEAAAAAGASPGGCLFVSSDSGRARGARHAGMSVHLFAGVDRLREALAPVLALSPAGESDGHAAGPGGRRQGGSTG